MKFFKSKGYKVISGFIYGWGASCVIIGALFKIMHFPNAGLILTVGMVVEAFIFFFSAFEPVMEQYDWSRVFPQLARRSLKEKESGEMSTESFSLGLKGLEQSDIDELKKGIRKIAETADTMSTIAGYVPLITRKMDKISDTFEALQTQTEQVSRIMENSARELSSGCNEIHHIMADTARNLSEELKNNCGEIIAGGRKVTEQFSMLGNIIGQQVEGIKSGAHIYSLSMEETNRNLNVLCDLYKVQVQENKSIMETFRTMNGNLSEVSQQVAATTGSAKQFKDESRQLSERVSALNSVYANMLSLVNNN